MNVSSEVEVAVVVVVYKSIAQVCRLLKSYRT